MNWLAELIEYTIYSSYVKDESPVSLLIVAAPDMGKTKLLETYSQNPNVLYIADFTRFGLMRDSINDIQDGKKRIIMVPDLVQLIAGKSKSSADGVIGFLNGITEEGITNISTYGIRLNLKEPVKVGFVGAIPKDVFFDRRSNWRKMGFISRTLPVSYSYSKQTTEEILTYILQSRHTNETPTVLKLPNESTSVTISEEMARKMLPLSQFIAKSLGEIGFRLQRHLQVLAKARALSLGRNIVNKDDTQRIMELAAWINLDFNST